MSKFDRPRVLVTGGAGFLGSFLCDRYIKEGWHVICLDNFFTGSIDNIKHLMGNPYFEYVRHDIIDPYKEFTMNELAEEVLSLVGGPSKVTYHPLPSDDPTQRKPDLTTANKELDWQPQVALRDGLKETISYFKERLAQTADLLGRRSQTCR